jgi:hypothetical protein
MFQPVPAPPDDASFLRSLMALSAAVETAAAPPQGPAEKNGESQPVRINIRLNNQQS